MQATKPAMIFKEGLPTEYEMDLLSNDPGQSCLILDDLMTEINSKKNIEKTMDGSFAPF
jgi:hypothetical protein